MRIIKDIIKESKEYLLSTNNFEKPKILTEYNAVCMYLLRLMILTPGTIESRPEMGVGIVSLWRYSDSEELDDLKREIKKQIGMFLPQYTLYNVTLTMKDQELLIEIDLDHILYSFITNKNELQLYQL